MKIKRLKTHDLHVRFTKEEREEIDRRAALEFLKPAPYVKRAALMYPFKGEGSSDGK